MQPPAARRLHGPGLCYAPLAMATRHLAFAARGRWAASNLRRSRSSIWHARSCNRLADDGDVRGLTRRINGGETGLRERAALKEQALKALRG